MLLVPLSGRDETRGAKLYLAPGLLFATAVDRNRSDLLDVRVDAVVPGHALRLNRDRVAEWSNVILPYARVVLRAARNEWLSARSPDSPPLPHDIKGMLAALPPLNRALAAAMWDAINRKGERGVLVSSLLHVCCDGRSAAAEDGGCGLVYALAHIGGSLFGHFCALMSQSDYVTATALFESMQSNALLLDASPVPAHRRIGSSASCPAGR